MTFRRKNALNLSIKSEIIYPKKIRRMKKMAAKAGDPESIIMYIRSVQPSKVMD